MTTKEAAEFFGNASKLAEALNISRSAVSKWGDVPPALRQYQLQALSDGKLQINAT
jgi:DNA-binding transcriptional regulator YdaS (Cro superfamily)